MTTESLTSLRILVADVAVVAGSLTFAFTNATSNPALAVTALVLTIAPLTLAAREYLTVKAAIASKPGP
jgi:hypothetical protein